VPSGTGLGSSGAFLVGLCSLMNIIKNKKVTKAQLASEASIIDINLLKSQGGYQDQFASTFGGFNKFTFYQNGKFEKKKIYLNNFIKSFEDSSILVFTGKTRKSDKILSVQNNNMKNKYKKSLVLELLNLGSHFLKSSSSRKDIYQLYIECMTESWKIKKELSKGIFDNSMEGLYSLLKKEGMKTGKVLGAGGGGFFLASFSNYEEKKVFFSKYRKKLKILEFNFYDKGSQVL
jgi:D-glycero-alpha-D-manno-heptose-7-phosphate kinase